MAAIDRIETLRLRDDIVGMDFVFVSEDQRTLFVFFHPSATLTPQQILGAVQASQIRIYSPSGGESLPVVPLDPGFPPVFITMFGRRVLQVITTTPGDFSRYRFRLDHPLVDPYFQEVGFSFKANCPSELDCAPLPHECPEEDLIDYPVNYQARDFWSIRQALLDFAADRHPDWKDRLEADVGMMLAEVMSAMGDDFAYYQDRISREGYFESATQRRSLRRHARMVDYHLHDGKGGATWLDFSVDASALIHVISAGTSVWVSPPAVTATETPAQRRGRSPSVYEVGHGIVQGHSGLTPPLGVLASQSNIYPSSTFNLRNGANAMAAYQWDENDACLLVGSTFLHVIGHHAADLPLEDFTNPDVPGKWAVLKTNPIDASVPARTWLVRLIRVTNEVDPLTVTNITRLEWEPAQATRFELELETLVVRGNIVPATAGETLEAFFQIEPTPQALVLPSSPPAPLPASNPHYNETFSGYAIERSSLLFTLPGSEQRDVISHGPTLDHATPEVRVIEGDFVAGVFVPTAEWEWKRSMLGVSSSLPTDKHFTLDDGSWRRVALFRRVDETGTPQEFIHFDYANGRGATVQFGNGEFGEVPTRGMDLRVVYRLGHGRGNNVAADSLNDFDGAVLPFVIAATNPFGITDAIDPETANEARHVAPDAFRAETFRAVRAEDYASAVEKLDWVQRAGAQFRWTGSWLTLFATPDPKRSFTLTTEERRELERQLDRYRLAARETHGMNPKFANLDLEIHICVEPSSYIGEVKEAVLKALFGRRGVRPHTGFFSPDNWTFGDSLKRAQLEAVIQGVPGVRAVEEIYIRRRGWFARRIFDELVYSVAADEIIRVENNPELPERGAVRLVMEGGA
ncbi:MAG: hypothetical protein H0U18_17290 [Pyrinomonadaceae bacterium]|nr:hypothetical protein [Pyrinomonadaceae bacterium]